MTFPAISQRDRLADVRARAKELRDRRNRARDFHQAAREAASNYNGQDLDRSEEFLRLQRAAGDLDQITHGLELVEAEERYVLGQLAGLDGADNVLVGRDSFLHDPQALSELAQLAHSPTPIGNRGLGTLVSRDEWVARHGQAAAADWRLDTDSRTGRWAVSDLDTPPTSPSRSRFIGVVPQLRRPLTLLDVIPTQLMETGSFDYEREGGSQGTAAEKSEGAVTASADVTLSEATVTAKTISHYLKVKREQLADMSSLAQVLNARLSYGVQLRLESQILNGDGVGENLTGILNTTGIGAPASGAGDDHNADLVANGIANVMSSGAQPTAVVLNPVNAIAMAKAKASTSGLRLDSDGAFAEALLSSLWGIPVILNLGMPVGQALVGDWTLGATLWVREGVAVRISDSDQDDFLRHKTTLMSSGRWGLAVWQTGCFAKVALSFPA
jgi:hypothetical protein